MLWVAWWSMRGVLVVAAEACDTWSAWSTPGYDAYGSEGLVAAEACDTWSACTSSEDAI